MKTSIYSQHHDHTGWLNKLSFYNDEITIMQKSLEEVDSKNTSSQLKRKSNTSRTSSLFRKTILITFTIT